MVILITQLCLKTLEFLICIAISGIYEWTFIHVAMCIYTYIFKPGRIASVRESMRVCVFACVCVRPRGY